jgi:hypothetical protein
VLLSAAFQLISASQLKDQLSSRGRVLAPHMPRFAPGHRRRPIFGTRQAQSASSPVAASLGGLEQGHSLRCPQDRAVRGLQQADKPARLQELPLDFGAAAPRSVAVPLLQPVTYWVSSCAIWL